MSAHEVLFIKYHSNPFEKEMPEHEIDMREHHLPVLLKNHPAYFEYAAWRTALHSKPEKNTRTRQRSIVVCILTHMVQYIRWMHYICIYIILGGIHKPI